MVYIVKLSFGFHPCKFKAFDVKYYRNSKNNLSDSPDKEVSSDQTEYLDLSVNAHRHAD